MNKLIILILVTAFAATLTPALASAKSWPQIDQSFYCTMQAPGQGGTYSTEALNSNFTCVSRQTNALKNWIDQILAQMPLPTESIPVPSGPPVDICPNGICPPTIIETPPAKPIEGIPSTPVKLCDIKIVDQTITVSCDEKGLPITQKGWKGDDVKIIQEFLRTEGSFKYPQTTGYFGTLTGDAVRTFQKKYNLPSTGVVDKPTLEKMQSASSQIAPAQTSRINNLKPSNR